MMKRILCPTDFSDAAYGAIEYAARLAQAANCSLTLLHIQSVFDRNHGNIVKSEQIPGPEIAERLKVQSAEVSKMFKIPCYAEVELRAGKLSSAIHEKARAYDLIVMGSNGPDDLYQFFTGSNTYNTLSYGGIPVLVIPAGFVYKKIKNVVYAFDYLRERTLPLKVLTPWARSLGCEITVLQVMEEAYSKEAEDDLKELQFIISTRQENDLKYKYDTIRSSDIAQSINSYILKNQPDALALRSSNRNLTQRIFHKSVIKHISAICSYPVFVFHE